MLTDFGLQFMNGPAGLHYSFVLVSKQLILLMSSREQNRLNVKNFTLVCILLRYQGFSLSLRSF